MRKSLLKNNRAQRLRRHTLLSFPSSSLILFITCVRERRLFAPIDFNAKPFLIPQLV